jgi:phosphonate transport system substrate-binding protein
MRAARYTGKGWSGIVAILALAIAGTALSLVIYDRATKKPLEEAKQFEMEQMVTMTGLNRPVNNQLDPKYADANGDLVADPAEAKDQIDPPTLKFCYITEESDEDFKTAFADLTAAISKATGKPVEFVTFDSTIEQLQAIRDGNLHVTGLLTGSVPLAVDAAGFVPAAMMADTTGSGAYQMEIIVPADSPIKKLEDLKGRNTDDNVLTCTEPASNSGCKAALLLMKSKDMFPGRDYRIIYSGGQNNSIEAVADKTAKVACVANEVLKREIAAGKISEGQYRSIYKSESFPSAGLGYSHGLKPELAEKIRAAILGFNFAGTSVEKHFPGRVKFIPVNYKEDWALIRQFDNATGTKHELP